MKYGRLYVALIVIFMSLGITGAATAATVEETEDLAIEFRGILEVGAVGADETHPQVTGPRIGMARLAGRGVYEDLGRFFVQYDASSGDARLLDVLGVLELTDWLNLRLGYFKTPISTDYNISASQKPFPGRALVADLTPRRAAGGELAAELPLGEATTAFHLGIFQPGFPDAPPASGDLYTARAEITWPMGLGLHLGYVDHFDQIEVVDDEDAAFYVEQPRLIDLAATYSDDDWFGHIEAVIAPHRDPGFVPAGVYVAVGHRIGNLEEETTFEPIVGYDFIALDTDFPFHRIRAGMNAYLLDYRVVPNIHYEMNIGADSSVGHAVFGLLRIAM